MAGNGALVAALGLDAGQSAETMRLLTLVSLASSKRVLDFGAVAAALQVRQARGCPLFLRACGAAPLSPAADYPQFLVCDRAMIARTT